jgi:1-acyl-sn-glycerol-3-phosphate acyltransferase
VSDFLYQAVRLLRFPFAYHCTGLENIRDSGPAIYVANHLDSVGPVEVVLSVPVRFHPWVIAEMTDPKRAPRYLYDDFVGPIWHLRERFGMAVAAVLSRLTVGLLLGLNCISVDRNRRRYMGAFHRSLARLEAGGNLLIFPEDPKGPLDPATRMRPFMAGFLLLRSRYERLAGHQPPVYPVAVHRERRIVSIGTPLFLAPPGKEWRADVLQARDRVQAAVKELYRAVGGPTCTRTGRE